MERNIGEGVGMGFYPFLRGVEYFVHWGAVLARATGRSEQRSSGVLRVTADRIRTRYMHKHDPKSLPLKKPKKMG